MKAVLILLLAAVLGACTAQQARDTALASAHLAALQTQYEHAERIYNDNIENVPAPRRSAIARAWAVVDVMNARLQSGDAIEVIEAVAFYELARPAWQQLRDEAVELIASGAIQDPFDVARLMEIDRRAKRLDEAMKRLNEPDGASVSSVVSDLMPLVSLVARLAL